MITFLFLIILLVTFYYIISNIKFIKIYIITRIEKFLNICVIVSNKFLEIIKETLMEYSEKKFLPEFIMMLLLSTLSLFVFNAHLEDYLRLKRERK